jgi:CheY-like chemotaxis protein
MSRIIYFHWHASEAEQRAERLRRAGHQVTALSTGSSPSLRPIRQNPPEGFIIDLKRAPSHGLAVAIWLRQQKATRHLPLVFVVGDPLKTGKVREMLPDAVYAGWEQIGPALQEALASPPQKPIVPGTMDSYAVAPLAKKLGINAGSAVALINAPPDFAQELGDLPSGASLYTGASGEYDAVLLFVRSQAELERQFPAASRAVAEGGRLWLVWPKKASRVATDLSQNSVRALGLAAKWVDYKIAAIDATWSGLCFARRAADKP